MRGGDAVVLALEKEGVEYISGFAGGGGVSYLRLPVT